MGKPVSLYLDEDVIAVYEAEAARRETSLSRYVNDTLRAAEGQRWPLGFFDLFGGVEDSGFTRPEQPPVSADVPRQLP